MLLCYFIPNESFISSHVKGFQNHRKHHENTDYIHLPHFELYFYFYISRTLILYWQTPKFGLEIHFFNVKLQAVLWIKLNIQKIMIDLSIAKHH